MDDDGKVTYSKIIVLENKDADFVLSPNPGRDIVFFSKNLDSFTIYNSFGQKIMESQAPANSVSVAAFNNGIYILQSGSMVRMFGVQH
jgi:hypothetical protein